MQNLWQTWVELNRKYDQLPEPRRFFTFFIPMGLFIVFIHVFRLYAIETQNVYVGAASITLFLILCAIGVARYLYTKGR